MIFQVMVRKTLSLQKTLSQNAQAPAGIRLSVSYKELPVFDNPATGVIFPDCKKQNALSILHTNLLYRNNYANKYFHTSPFSIKVKLFFKQWGGANKKKTGRTLLDRNLDDMPDRDAHSGWWNWRWKHGETGISYTFSIRCIKALPTTDPITNPKMAPATKSENQ